MNKGLNMKQNSYGDSPDGMMVAMIDTIVKHQPIEDVIEALADSLVEASRRSVRCLPGDRWESLLDLVDRLRAVEIPPNLKGDYLFTKGVTDGSEPEKTSPTSTLV